MRSSNNYLNRRISSVYDFTQSIRILREDKIGVFFVGRKKKIPIQPFMSGRNIGDQPALEDLAGGIPQHDQGKQYETEGYQNVGTNQADGCHKRIVYNLSTRF